MKGLTGHPSTARQARSSGRTVKPYFLVVKKLMNFYLILSFSWAEAHSYRIEFNPTGVKGLLHFITSHDILRIEQFLKQA